MLSQPITVIARDKTGEDDYGNDIISTTGTSAVEGYAEQTDAREITFNRETYVSDWLVILPAGTAVNGRSQFQVGSHLLEVVGNPGEGEWNPRRSRYEQVECDCIEVAG